MVRGLGAGAAIDTTRHDFVDGGPRVDVNVDSVATRAMSADLQDAARCDIAQARAPQRAALGAAIGPRCW